MKNTINQSIISVIIMAAVVLLYSPFHANALTLSDVESNLTCYACPGEPLNIDRCGGGDQMRATIKRMIKEGKPKSEILDYFEKKYGETILTMPPKRGFNLVAYAAPFVGLTVGVVIAFFLVKKWGVSAETGDTDVGDAALSSEMQKKIDDEVSMLDEEDE